MTAPTRKHQPLDGIMDEFSVIARFASALPRPVGMLNSLHESDAELLSIGEGQILAVTTDDLVEELRLGLYTDPDLIGWMAVTASASDLAAVGAAPLAALINIGAPADLDPDFLDGVARGVAAAARRTGLGIAGGDTNETPEFRIGCTAFGTVSSGTPLTRRGCMAGDLLFATAPLGSGARFALERLAGGPASPFRPIARIEEGLLLRDLASACIDTSDGALDAMHRLLLVNDVAIEVELGDGSCLDAAAAEAMARAHLPTWLLLASLHGEFELLFTVPPERLGHMEAAFRDASTRPVRVGRVTRAERPDDRSRDGLQGSGKSTPQPRLGTRHVRIHDGNRRFSLDPMAARRIYDDFDGDLANLIYNLLTLPKP